MSAPHGGTSHGGTAHGGMIAGPSVRRQKPVSIFGGDVATLLYSDPRLGGDGRTRINPDKGNAKWLWISANLNGATPFTVPNGAIVTASVTVAPTGGAQDGDFEAATILARSVTAAGAFARVALQPYVNTEKVNRYFSNQPISSPLISGVSQLPGALLASTYCLPKTSWQFAVQGIQGIAAGDASVQVSLFGRQFQGCSPCKTERLRRRAEHLRWFHPYWIGPQDPSQPAYTGPAVTLLPGTSATLTFPIPSSADFLMFGALDDSTSSGGGEPSLYAQITMNDSQRGLVDLPATTTPVANASALGISWRDFLAIPTVTGVVGFQLSKINSFGLAPNLGGITHLVPRNTQVVIKFTSTETVNTITLRPALFGLLVYGRQVGRDFSADGQAHRERVRQAHEFLRRMRLMPVDLDGKLTTSKTAGGKDWR